MQSSDAIAAFLENGGRVVRLQGTLPVTGPEVLEYLGGCGITATYSPGLDGSGRTNSVQLGIYAGFTQGAFYVDGLAGYAYNDSEMKRNILIPGLAPRTATGNTHADQFTGQVETGYRFALGGEGALTPFARLQASTATQRAFTETGADSLNLVVDPQITRSLRSILGGQIEGKIDAGWRDKLALQFRLGWAHEYVGDANTVQASFAGAPGSSFSVLGAQTGRDSAILGLAANTAVGDATSLYLRYDGDIASTAASHAFTAGLRMVW